MVLFWGIFDSLSRKVQFWIECLACIIHYWKVNLSKLFYEMWSLVKPLQNDGEESNFFFHIITPLFVFSRRHPCLRRQLFNIELLQYSFPLEPHSLAWVKFKATGVEPLDKLHNLVCSWQTDAFHSDRFLPEHIKFKPSPWACSSFCSCSQQIVLLQCFGSDGLSCSSTLLALEELKRFDDQIKAK